MTRATEVDLDRGPSFSPLKRFQRDHCQQCTDNCNPSERRFLACLLTTLLATTERKQPKTRAADTALKEKLAGKR